MTIDGTTTIVGVFGAPVTHTASPAMHNAAFDALKMNWRYLAFHVEPENLRSALHGARDMGIFGVNLTVPHKILALDCIDEMDAEARKLGATNTILFEKDRLRGFNTDGYGFVQGIKEDFNLTVKGKRVLILGAGGAGRAIAVKCALEGATKIMVANRTLARLEPIAREIRATRSEFLPLALTVEEVEKVIHDVDLMVNATSLGLNKGDALGLEAGLFSPQLHVYDIIYRPAETEFLRVAARAGAKVANGLSMLLHQGARAFEIWTKRKAPLAVMRRTLRAAIDGDNT
ncbi:MAG TPA: shikimate dehydrogenase [Verrucomicrobiae bacterium]|nr:shikimate dehydrogenase [Verrucomicrobiae bacterium]